MTTGQMVMLWVMWALTLVLAWFSCRQARRLDNLEIQVLMLTTIVTQHGWPRGAAEPDTASDPFSIISPEEETDADAKAETGGTPITGIHG